MQISHSLPLQFFDFKLDMENKKPICGLQMELSRLW